jgi:group I intron endonuclease
MVSIKNKNKKDYYGFLIYKLTNPKGQIYIGATTNLKERMKYYRTTQSCKNQTNLKKSLLKWGIDNHKLEIIYRHPANEPLNTTTLNILEQKYIWKEYITNQPNLLNIVVKGAERGRNENNIII